MKTALVLGATGLTGSICIQKLLNDERYTNVIAMSRRQLAISHAKLVRVEMNDEQLQSVFHQHNIDEVYCCLGTTIKKAGSQQAFKAIDKDLVVDLASCALDSGVGKFAVISALGASEKAFGFYNRVKGEMEQGLIALGFAQLVIVRPSLILGPRIESRTGEDLAKSFYRMVAPIANKLLPDHRPIEAEAIVTAMIDGVNQVQPHAVTIIENKEMHVA
ncbi:NAD-dependent epimerase/dehydratase family protein [Thalassotalea litorea]|uniref:NAD-dependent epimerase/dehydratase family protein n=1 Tax=Thalassotalea litorea TaxID=2020715 RepID=A0A5R9IPP2_9GAMM|nr:NAD-dependent epimerase/dehydratase family protein [Thalassotalea litorea]TLU67514.1 NAD-dependent epimerase/dehydratase family protein [Thalassotalea litorea]